MKLRTLFIIQGDAGVMFDSPPLAIQRNNVRTTDIAHKYQTGTDQLTR